LIALLRDIVLSEEDGWLLVDDGAPDAWLDTGRRVSLSAAPTHYGLASVSLWRVSAAELRVQLDGSPPAGWRVRLPGSPSSVRVDAADVPVPSDSQLRVPTGAHAVTVGYLASAAAATLRASAN
jgi:hypothetical protein